MTRRATKWIWLNLIPILVIGGATCAIIGAAALAGVLTANIAGVPAGIAAAATVGGSLTSLAALRWSRLVIVDEGRSQ